MRDKLVIEKKLKDLEDCIGSNDKIFSQKILNSLKSEYCGKSLIIEKIIEAEEVLAGRLMGDQYSTIMAIESAISMYEK